MIENIYYFCEIPETPMETRKMNLLEYVDKAKKRSGVRSDIQLSKMLGVSSNAVSYYKNKNVLPTDETMIKLAAIAGVDPTQALLDLNVWRAPEKVKPHYMKIMSRVSAAALSVAILAFPALAHAGILENVASSGGQYILWEIQEAF